MSKRARVVALYLPQFHPIPENDEWWGPGFTEWTNVARARPLFRGHVQPHLPADLGFYDLRLGEARQRQAELAREYGVEAFCYWHYWFGDGRRILQRPFEEVLATGEPRLSFCLGWANETWSGIWHGTPDRVLVEQQYPGVDDVEVHFQSLLGAFRDDRYFRINGRPVFHVYKPADLPSAAAFVDQWQALAKASGLEPFYMIAGIKGGYATHVADGFDSGFDSTLPVGRPRGLPVLRGLRRRISGSPLIYKYPDQPNGFVPRGLDPEKVQPVVIPNWDNTPRSGSNGVVMVGSTPERFRMHVRSAVQFLENREESERILWVKSWNEWAEGNYLEPDLEVGHARLQVLREEIER